jgi:polyisoprenoid-binding protein YceI
VFKSAAMAVLVCTLVACGTLRPSAPAPQEPRAPAPQEPSAPAPGLQALPAPGTYKIDSSASELRILVFRAGTLANLGHNHVMINRSVSGVVQIADSVSASSFSLEVPADKFEIDNAQSRLEEGSEFPGDIPADAKSGTRRNMLSRAVLNASQFPVVEVKSTALRGTPSAVIADLALTVAGHESAVSVPLSLQGDSQHLTATGSIELRQTAIGLRPYSLLHGALEVRDVMRLKFKIVVPTN